MVKDQIEGWARNCLLGSAFTSIVFGYVWLLGTLGQARNMVTWVGAHVDWPVNAAMTRYMEPFEGESEQGAPDSSATNE
jgi:hypothetical protein